MKSLKDKNVELISDCDLNDNIRKMYNILLSIFQNLKELNFKIELTHYISKLCESPTVIDIKITPQMDVFYPAKSGAAFYSTDDINYSKLNISNLSSTISSKLKEIGNYRQRENGMEYLSPETINLIFDLNLVVEILQFCDDIMMEVRDLGFDIKIYYRPQRLGGISVPPCQIFVVIEKYNKFVLLHDKDEMVLIYQTGRGDTNELDLKEYIDWLSSYLKDWNISFSQYEYSYDNKIIKLTFNSPNQKGFDISPVFFFDKK